MAISGYVVVLFGGSADGWCDLNRCPMYAIGPYLTSEDAHAAAEDQPAWTQPHILRLKPTEGDDAESDISGELSSGRGLRAEPGSNK